MHPFSFIRGPLDVALALLLGIGCLQSLPLYWWLFVSPLIRLFKQAGKTPAYRIG